MYLMDEHHFHHLLIIVLNQILYGQLATEADTCL
jgi:hypothetical protein